MQCFCFLWSKGYGLGLCWHCLQAIVKNRDTLDANYRIIVLLIPGPEKKVGRKAQKEDSHSRNSLEREPVIS